MTAAVAIKEPLVDDDAEAGPDVNRRSPAVAEKLAEAEAALAALEASQGAVALAAVEGEAGATGKARAHAAKTSDVRALVEMLRAAYSSALAHDERTAAAEEREQHAAQLAELQAPADRRLEHMRRCCAALKTAAEEWIGFYEATAEMQRQIPSGVLESPITCYALEVMVDGRPFPADPEVVLAGEMFRHGRPAADGTLRQLPGVKPPVESLRLVPHKIEPADDMVARVNGYIVGQLDAQFKAIEARTAARLQKENP